MSAETLPSLPPAERATPAWVWAAVLIGLTLVVYGLGVTNGYVPWDDEELIQKNPMLQAGHAAELGGAWRHPYAGLYAPLTYTVYVAIATVERWLHSPLDPSGFHATAIVLHAAAGVLLWLWLRRLCRETGAGSDLAAFVGAAVWLVHPLQAEPVSWAGGMNTVLAGMLAIAALLAGTLGVTDRGLRRWSWLAASIVLVGASLAAKPSGVLLPLMLLAVHRLILRRPWRETLILAAAWAAAVTPFALIGRTAQTSWIPFIEIAQRPKVAAHATGFYLAHVVWPRNLAIDYGLTPWRVVRENVWLWPACGAAVTLTVVLLLARRVPWLAAGMAVFMAGIGPVLGLMPFYFQGYSTVADRYAYLSLIGVAVVIAFSVRRLPSKALGWLATPVLLVLAGLTAMQVTVWHDGNSLLSSTLAVNPYSIAANAQLGAEAMDSGDLAFAETAFRRVLSRQPDDGQMLFRLGHLLMQTGRPAEAADQFGRLLQSQPNSVKLLQDRARALAESGQTPQAIDMLERARALDPSNPDTQQALARLRAAPATTRAATAPVASADAGRYGATLH